MNCKHCKAEMEEIRSTAITLYHIFWCSSCGTVYNEEMDDWKNPSSVDRIKFLSDELRKANEKISGMARKVNRMMDEQREDIGWPDRDR